jgi:hypothetical protein
MLRFRHQTVFGLCLTVVVLTGAVVASIALMLFERQDVTLLQDRIAELADENAALKRRLQAVARPALIEAPVQITGDPAPPTDGDRAETTGSSAEAGNIAGHDRPGH